MCTCLIYKIINKLVRYCFFYNSKPKNDITCLATCVYFIIDWAHQKLSLRYGWWSAVVNKDITVPVYTELSFFETKHILKIFCVM